MQTYLNHTKFFSDINYDSYYQEEKKVDNFLQNYITTKEDIAKAQTLFKVDLETVKHELEMFNKFKRDYLLYHKRILEEDFYDPIFTFKAFVKRFKRAHSYFVALQLQKQKQRKKEKNHEKK